MRTRCKMKIITCTTPLLEQNMYIVEEGKHCIVIDPYYDEKTAVLLEGKIVDLLLVTHEHYDHISGVNKFKELYGANCCQTQNVIIICKGLPKFLQIF